MPPPARWGIPTPQPAPFVSVARPSSSFSSRSTRWRHARRWEALLTRGESTPILIELSRGLDPNISMADGITPIMRCARDGDDDMLLTILQSSLKPLKIDARSKIGLTAAGLAVKNQHPTALDILISFGSTLHSGECSPLNPLMIAASHGSDQCLARIIEAGAHVNRHARDGSSPLSVACMGGKLGCVRLLLAAGADPNASTRQGQTPLMLACGNGSSAVAWELLRAGASLEPHDSVGLRVLMLAARAGSIPLIDLLLSSGADLHAKDFFGRDAQAHAELVGEHEAGAALSHHKAALTERLSISHFCVPQSHVFVPFASARKPGPGSRL